MLKINKFNVRVVGVGESYGLNNCLTNDKAPLVEFYDSRYPHTEWGQFVSRYYASTLLEKNGSYSGLCLDGGVPEWSITASELSEVINYIKQGL